MSKRPAKIPPQHQKRQPGITAKMHPKPQDKMAKYRSADKLKNKVAIVTGGDSGIGRAVAIGFAKEGADVVIVYLEETRDAQVTKRWIEKEGRRCHLIAGNIGEEKFCERVVIETIKKFGKLDVLVNNAAEQHSQDKPEDIPSEQLVITYKTNLFSFFYLTQYALPHMKKGSSIINTTSVTAYKGNDELIDYSSTKGAIVAFTRSLSGSLATKGIRVNAVAPGPIWTPLIPASFTKEHVAKFGKNTPMGRPGQPDEVAPCYIFLASEDASYMSGQVLHPNGGTVVNS